MPIETSTYLPSEPLLPGFLPAESKQEAVARLYALSGAAPEPLGPGSKEKKSVLVGLASSLGIAVDDKLPKPRYAAEIAEALGGAWTDACWSAGNTITLRGLNALLKTSSEAFAWRSEQSRVEAELERLVGAPFVPARSKIEAVSRISALTGSGPETLGPGSKERKSVLVNVSSGLGLPIDTSLNKVELGRALAETLGLSWGPEHFSTGHTITLEGLNVVLKGAERRLGREGADAAGTLDDPVTEAEALLSSLADAIREDWDGRTTITRMRDAEFRHWRQTEWFGWYFELIGIPTMIDAFGGGRARFNNTDFDYRLNTVWDLKAHDRQGGTSKTAILNDHAAVLACLRAGEGLGFLVLSGEADYEGHLEFAEWRRDFCGEGRSPRPKVERAYSRRLKTAFSPATLQAFRLRDLDHLDAALAGGQMRVAPQGRQQSGKPRNMKVHMHLPRASSPGGLLIAERDCGAPSELLL